MKDLHNYFYNNAVDKSTFFYSIDEKCRKITLLSVLSLLQSAEKESQSIDIKVLCFTNELFESLSIDLAMLSSKFSSQAEPYLVEPGDTNHIPLKNSNRPLASYGRIIIPRLFDNLQGPVRYLDADTIVESLPSLPIDNKYALSALKENITSEHRFGYRHKCLLSNGYFNSGVLLYNIDNYNDNNIEGETTKFLFENPHSSLPDQDALNYALRDGFGILPVGYNILPWDYNENIADIKILHYAANPKPWQINTLPQIYIDTLIHSQKTLLEFFSIDINIDIIQPSYNFSFEIKRCLSKMLGESGSFVRNILRDKGKYDIKDIVKYRFYLKYPGFSAKNIDK